MDTENRPGRQGQAEHLTWERLVGLQGRLARPFWGFLGGWSVLCGALASKQLRWDGEILLTLALVVILSDLAWGSLWDLAIGTNWFRLLAQKWTLPEPFRPSGLPYTLVDSPGGRLSRRWRGFAGWWRNVLWPQAGPAVLGLLAAVALTAILSLLLPGPIRLLNAALAALAGLGLFQQSRGRPPLAGQALAQVLLSWLAGYVVFAGPGWDSLLVALSLSLAAWGALRVGNEKRWGLWLLNAGLLSSVALVVAWKQVVAAGLMGLLFFGALAVQLTIRSGDEGGSISANAATFGERKRNGSNLRDRTAPWLMGMMLVAAFVVP